MSEWRDYKVQELGKVVTGTTPPSSRPDDFGEEYLFVTPSDYKFYNKYITITDRKLSPEGFGKLYSRHLSPGSIMVTCIGSDMGKVALNKVTVVTNQQINSVLPDFSLVSSDFLYYKFRDEYETLRMYGGDGTAVPIVNKTTFENIVLSIPPLPEQQAIAEVLSSLDDKIDLLHRQNKTLEQMAENLFRQWFVEEAEEDWEEKRIGDFAILNPESIKGSYEHKIMKYLDTGSITDGYVTGYQFFSPAEAPSRAQRLVKDGDIVYSLVRPNQKHYGLIKKPLPNLVVSTGFCVVRAVNVSPYYLYYLLKRPEAIDHFSSVADGSTTAYPCMKPDDLRSYAFQFPLDTKRMTLFHNIVETHWERISNNQSCIRLLSITRDVLLPKLMSGAVSVKT